MQVLLDDKPCDFEAHTVGQAIEGAAALARDRGRLIVDVSVDGSRWTDSRLGRPETESAVADVVRLVSAEPAELVRETFRQAREALVEVDRLQQEAAELLQSDRQAASMDTLSEAITIWLSVRQAVVQGAQLTGLDLNDVNTPHPIIESIHSLNQRLEILRTALTRRDLIGLSDALLYEFPEVIEGWQAALTELERRVEESTDGSCR